MFPIFVFLPPGNLTSRSSFSLSLLLPDSFCVCVLTPSRLLLPPFVAQTCYSQTLTLPLYLGCIFLYHSVCTSAVLFLRGDKFTRQSVTLPRSEKYRVGSCTGSLPPTPLSRAPLLTLVPAPSGPGSAARRFPHGSRPASTGHGAMSHSLTPSQILTV